MRSAEPRFAPLIERHGAPTLSPTRDPFATLGSAIIHQQLAGAAAKTIQGRFLGLYPRTAFPRPAALLATPLERLRAVGLSQAKARALLDLAAHFADRRITAPTLMASDDDEVARRLLPVRGIGPWSVDMFLMFGLCRPDVWPVGDLGVRLGLRQFLRLRTTPAGPRLVKLAGPWRPFRSLAAWYMWRAVEDARASAR
ncbi:MAG: DNA-3-methyladenine glycosylase 2 family protein [Myxococcales bacterium]|nr:DNA-3-methyladenine glycosylase 2 family protein [Myxococcales bacterium]